MLKKDILCFLLLYINYSNAEIYAISYASQFYFEEFEDYVAAFGNQLSNPIRAMLVYSNPPDACNYTALPPIDDNETRKWAVIIPRFTDERNCSFEQKVRVAQTAGYDAVIVHNVFSDRLVKMTANNDTGILIPAVFVSETSGFTLRDHYATKNYFVVITGETPYNIQTHLLIPFAIVVGICFIIMVIFMVVKCIKDRRRRHRHRLPTSTLNKIPTCKYKKGDPYETCAICLDDYVEGEKLRVLPCNHVYHTKCIDPWLTKNRRVCPICKRKVFAHDEAPHYSDSESDTDDTTPLIASGNRGTQGGTFTQQRENPIMRAVRSVSQQSGAAGGNFINASDHHSINGQYRNICEISSDTSSNSSSTTSNDNFEECIVRSLVHMVDEEFDHGDHGATHDHDHGATHDHDHGATHDPEQDYSHSLPSCSGEVDV